MYTCLLISQGFFSLRASVLLTFGSSLLCLACVDNKCADQDQAGAFPPFSAGIHA